MCAVGEVEPRNIETRFAHFGEYFRVAAGGPYRAYYLRLSHGYPFIPFYINQIHYIIFHLRVQYSRVKKQVKFADLHIILIPHKLRFIR